MELSRQLQPSPAAWLVGQAQTFYYANGFGYDLVHPIGAGADKVGVTLLDWSCENEVTGLESISIDNPTYTESANSTFSYGVTMNVGLIHNSSLVEFQTDPFGGASAGTIKFCTRVITKLERPGQPDMDVQFRETKISLGFDLRQNLFALANEIVIPSSSSCIPANVTLKNVTDPNDPSIVENMITTVKCGFETALDPYEASGALPSNFLVKFNTTSAYFLSPPPGMKHEMEICIVYPCLNPSFCASVNNNIVPKLMIPLFSQVHSKIKDGTVETEIANCDHNATGLEHSNPGPLEFENAGNISVPVLVVTPSELQSTLTIPTNVTIENVVPAQNSSIQTQMEDIVIQAIGNCIQPFAVSDLHQNNMSVTLIKNATSFPIGNFHNAFKVQLGYPCYSTTDCKDRVETVVEPVLQTLLNYLEAQLLNGKISNDINTIANGLGITNFNGMPATITEKFVYPLEPAPVPIISNNTIIGFTRSVFLDTNTTITGIVQPTTDLERSLMNNTVEEGFSRSLMNYTGALPDGMDLIIDLTDSDFFQPSSRRLIRSLQSQNVVEFHLTIVFHCDDDPTCDTVEASMPTVFSGLVATTDLLLQNGVIISHIQEVASEKGLSNFDSILTNSALEYPTTTVNLVTRHLQTSIPQLETGQIVGLSSSIALPVNVTINNVTSPNNATHEADMMTVVEKALESCLFNYTYQLPIGFDLVIASGEAIFDANTTEMLNCFDVKIVYPCVSIDDCALVSNIAETEMYDLVVEIRAKAVDGRLANEVINQAQEDNVPGFAISSTDQVDYPFLLGGDLRYEWADPIVTRQFSVLAASLCVANFTQPSTPSEEFQMKGVLALAITQVLQTLILGLPSDTTFSVEIPASNITSTEVKNEVDFKFEFDCDVDPLTVTPDCDLKHTAILNDYVPSLVNKMISSLNDGTLEASLRSYASTNNSSQYLFATVPDGCFVYPTITIVAPNPGQFIGISVNPVVISIFTQFGVDICQCDDFDLGCIVPPAPVQQNEVFSMCIYPNSNDVSISNLEMTITGDDNGFQYSPVTYGASGFVPTPPITQAFEVADKVLVKTYLLGGFYNTNGGTGTVSVTGNAMLEFDFENKAGRKLDTSTSTFKLQIGMTTGDDDEEGVEETSKFTLCLLKIIETVMKVMRKLGF